MEQLLKGIYYTIYGYLNEAQKRRNHLETLMTSCDEEAMRAYKEEYERLGDEIQKLSDLAEEINHM